MNQANRIVLGVDPGFVFAGFGVISVVSRSSVQLNACGVLRMRSTESIPSRILRFHDFFSEIITSRNITDLSLETPFLGKNAQNFLKLGYLRGVLLLLAERHHLPVAQFSPREVKAALTGFGGASKEQVSRVLYRLFPNLPPVSRFDITDALAVTMCAVWAPGSRPPSSLR